jgi:hypothetical protein
VIYLHLLNNFNNTGIVFHLLVSCSIWFITIKNKDGTEEKKLVSKEQLTEINKQLKEVTIGLSHDTDYRDNELRRIYNKVVNPSFSESPKQ